MADITKEQVVEFIANMTVLELSVFIKELEDKFGVSAAAPVAAFAAAPVAAAEAAEEEKTEFDVVLKEAKAKVDETPSVILEAAAKDAANDAKKQLEEAGAKVEIK